MFTYLSLKKGCSHVSKNIFNLHRELLVCRVDYVCCIIDWIPLAVLHCTPHPKIQKTYVELNKDGCLYVSKKIFLPKGLVSLWSKIIMLRCSPDSSSWIALYTSPRDSEDVELNQDSSLYVSIKIFLPEGLVSL